MPFVTRRHGEGLEATMTRTRTRLARVLFDRALTHDELSAASGVSRQTLSTAVNGRHVSLDTWLRRAAALGVTVGEIAPPEDAARIVAVA
jgi:DNA-binding Xre family transcriptional regulator